MVALPGATGGIFVANDEGRGSTADGTLFKLFETRFDSPAFLAVVGSLTASTKTIAAAAGAFTNVAVGATVSGSGITGTTTVTAKQPDGSQVTLAAAASDTTNATYSFYGKEVGAKAYLATDQLDQIGLMASLERVQTRHYCPTQELLKLTAYRDLARSSGQTMTLGISSGQRSIRDHVEMPTKARAISDVHELLIESQNGSRNASTAEYAQVWGIDAEYEPFDYRR